ncbi:MAG: carboxypeptidase-like regulatory domain-containing protein, partial [Actinobacteria bacterium]|nr:carboxypeptidase-like regulatory domain-containing protein [Actinomycetota bacterium]
MLTAAPKSAEATEYSTLSGTIVDAAGNPIPDLWVYCVWSDGRTATVMTDGDGNYTMHPPLATPLIGLNVSHRSLTLNYPQDNNEGSGPIGSRFDLTLPDFGLVTKTLHVQDAAGNPVANQQVVLGNQLAPFGWYVTVAIPTATGASIPATGTSQQLIGNTSLSAQVRLSTDWAKPSSASWTNPYVCITDGNGDCQVAGYPGQSYNIQVSLAEQPGFPIPSTVSATLDLATADTSAATAYSTLSGTIVDAAGNPIPDLWVYCVFGVGINRTATVMTDGDGNYTMHPPLATPLIGLNVSHRSLTLNYPQDNNEGSGP